jgi:hypothetical protein
MKWSEGDFESYRSMYHTMMVLHEKPNDDKLYATFAFNLSGDPDAMKDGWFFAKYLSLEGTDNVNEDLVKLLDPFRGQKRIRTVLLRGITNRI